jgi:hypothetical protein
MFGKHVELAPGDPAHPCAVDVSGNTDSSIASGLAVITTSILGAGRDSTGASKDAAIREGDKSMVKLDYTSADPKRRLGNSGGEEERVEEEEEEDKEEAALEEWNDIMS